MIRQDLSKAEITAAARALGAELVGYAPVSRWEEYQNLREDFYPHHIWPLTKTVIALAIPSLFLLWKQKFLTYTGRNIIIQTVCSIRLPICWPPF